MANLIRNDPTITSILPEFNLSLDPFKTMREMLRWDPMVDINRVLPTERISFNPTFDVKETNDAFIMHADVPGVAEKDIDISLTSNRLTITGKRETEHEVKGETYYRAERTWGNFSRSFTLPTDVDANKVSAELKNGVLVVQLPKSSESMAKRITVQAEKK